LPAVGRFGRVQYADPQAAGERGRGQAQRDLDGHTGRHFNPHALRFSFTYRFAHQDANSSADRHDGADARARRRDSDGAGGFSGVGDCWPESY
jgi:hypothetical protein